VHDYIIIGGGLQGGLLTLAIKYHQPKATILLIEKDCEVGGNHTWSFHPKDVPAEARPWIEPLVTSRWPSYFIRFPGFERRVNLPYATINSDHFATIVTESFRELQAVGDGEASAGVRYTRSSIGNKVSSQATATNASTQWSADQVESRLLTETEIELIDEKCVRTSDLVTFEGKVVIDCRGSTRLVNDAAFDGGFQKFFGFEIELDKDWPESYPVVMDACQDQSNGFRFIYSLPFSNRRVLVEDTQFSDDPSLDRAGCLLNVETFVRGKTDATWSIVREETGCLPMPLTKSSIPQANLPLRGGYAGGWFHAATGYSFPLAVRYANAVASVEPERAVEAVAALVVENQSQAKFARLLNRLLFRLVKPSKRWSIFRRFYRVLSDEAISRFYAHRFTKKDAFRIVVGRPPAGLTPLRFILSLWKQR